MNKQVVEFVAGLQDEFETVEACARRELSEEVGYQEGVSLIGLSPPIPMDAGQSGSLSAVVFLSVDGDHPNNQVENLKSHPEESEDIEVLRVPFKRLQKSILEFEKKGCLVGAMVWSYCIGLFGQGLPESLMDEKGTFAKRVRSRSESFEHASLMDQVNALWQNELEMTKKQENCQREWFQMHEKISTELKEAKEQNSQLDFEVTLRTEERNMQRTLLGLVVGTTAFALLVSTLRRSQ